MTIAIQTPFREESSVELSRALNLFRKQVLPKRSIDYKGRTITFDDAYLTDLAKAFNDRAFDQVPFQLAGADNAHTLDPERTRGEVKGFELTAEGLDAIVQLTDEGAEVVRTNPKLGISARIVEGLKRADGKEFGRAVQHVLGTLDPRVTGLKPWEAIALSNSDLEVIDLTNLSYPTKEATVPEDPKTPTISDENRAAFDAYMTELVALMDPSKTDPAKPAPKVDEPTEDEIDAELNRMMAEAMAEDGASLSNDAAGMDLVNVQLAAQRSALDETRAELDLARFEKEKGELIAKGIPPAMVDLAMPLLLGKDHTIDLSNGSTVDAGEVVRKLLGECEGIVDFSKETVPVPGGPATDKVQADLDRWETQHPSVISAAGSYKS